MPLADLELKPLPQTLRMRAQRFVQPSQSQSQRIPGTEDASPLSTPERKQRTSEGEETETDEEVAAEEQRARAEDAAAAAVFAEEQVMMSTASAPKHDATTGPSLSQGSSGC